MFREMRLKRQALDEGACREILKDGSIGVLSVAGDDGYPYGVPVNYVYEDGKHLFLTESGKAYASAVYERHCIIRDYLLARGISPKNAESDACKMEHLISEETFQMMKRGLPGQ